MKKVVVVLAVLLLASVLAVGCDMLGQSKGEWVAGYEGVGRGETDWIELNGRKVTIEVLGSEKFTVELQDSAWFVVPVYRGGPGTFHITPPIGNYVFKITPASEDVEWTIHIWQF